MRGAKMPGGFRMTSSAQRILLVDDHADATEPLGLLLQSKGHETRLVTSGEDALRMADAFRPHVVLLDLSLPDLDGYEVARRLRARDNGPSLTLVALTGWAGREVRDKAAAAGFDYHLVKPVDWEELDRIVESAARDALT